MQNVTVQSPFIDRAPAAAMLGISELQIQRLYGRGALQGVMVGNKLQFRPADLEAFALAGNPDLATAPEFARGWFAEGADNARRFYLEVLQNIKGQVLPTIPRTATGQIQTVINVPIAGALRAIVRQKPYASVVRIHGRADEAPRYATAAQEFAAVEIRRLVLAMIQRETKPLATAGGIGPLDSLYRSPEEYRRLVAGAVADFAAGSVATSVDYPDPAQVGAGNRVVRVIYRVRHSDLGVDLGDTTRRAF